MASELKIRTIAEVGDIVREEKAQNKTVGLITGCFDILHIGHINLFRFAKERTDILIVGIEQDETIRISKNSGRPIFSLAQRMEFLSELESVDWIFPIELVYNFASPEAEVVHYDILEKMKPNFIFTFPTVDVYMAERQARARRFGTELICYPGGSLQFFSTSHIIHSLEQEM